MKARILRQELSMPWKPSQFSRSQGPKLLLLLGPLARVDKAADEQ